MSIDKSAVVHPSSVIDSGAIIGANVTIGPFCHIGSEVTLNDDVELKSHVVVSGWTTIGEKTTIFPFASIGHIPQDLKFSGERTKLEIGKRNRIREHVTMNPGTDGGGGLTKIGDDGLFMMGVHIGHDCIVGNNVIMANNASLGGHCIIENNVVIGALAGVHQFCRLGESSFSAISTIIVKDIPPFVMVSGNTARARGINKVGMKRRGFEQVDIESVKRCYRIMYRRSLTTSSALVELEKEVASPVIAKIHRFVLESTRGIVR